MLMKRTNSFYLSFNFSSGDQIVKLIQGSFGSVNNTLEQTLFCDICILATLFSSGLSKEKAHKERCGTEGQSALIIVNEEITVEVDRKHAKSHNLLKVYQSYNYLKIHSAYDHHNPKAPKSTFSSLGHIFIFLVAQESLQFAMFQRLYKVSA